MSVCLCVCVGWSSAGVYCLAVMKVLNRSTDGACTAATSRWFHSLAVRTKKEFFGWSVLHLGTWKQCPGIVSVGGRGYHFSPHSQRMFSLLSDDQVNVLPGTQKVVRPIPTARPPCNHMVQPWYCLGASPWAHLNVVGMLWFMSKT